MKVTPVLPISQPRWVLKKPLTPIEPHKLELHPVEVEFIECVQVKEDNISWSNALWLASCGALAMYIILTGLIAFVRMVLGI